MSKRLKSIVLLAIMVVLVSASEKAPEKKITIAVYPIKMAGADKALEVPLTQILIREISQSSMLTVLEEDMISEVLKKQGFANSDLCDNSQCQISIGKLTPAQKLVTPVLSKLGDKFILDLKVTDIQTGGVDFVASRQKVCKEDELDQLASEAALVLRAKFGEKVDVPQPSSQPQSSPVSPSTPPFSDASRDSQNILSIVVENVGSKYQYGVVVKSVLPESPCKDIFKPGYVVAAIKPQGQIGINESMTPYTIRDVNDFRKQVVKVAPGASVGFNICTPTFCHRANCVIPSQPLTVPQAPAPPSTQIPSENKATKAKKK